MPDEATPVDKQGKRLPPKEVRIARAAAGGSASMTTEGLINRLVNRAPTLTSEQAEKLRALLPPCPKAVAKDGNES